MLLRFTLLVQDCQCRQHQLGPVPRGRCDVSKVLTKGKACTEPSRLRPDLRSSWLSSSRRAMRSRSFASPSRMPRHSSASRSSAARLAAASSLRLAVPLRSLACTLELV